MQLILTPTVRIIFRLTGNIPLEKTDSMIYNSVWINSAPILFFYLVGRLAHKPPQKLFEINGGMRASRPT